ncbi:helix-turn-helix domain-containing protein (plasmid) [Limimaricola variabilis]|uniref:GlxA family transcriptional regulator n=1 Tax=Limimaricola variabilis TaxID=1492771 RepID=UPI002AC94445|nr:helix-turn-helix domain-containing protein [Limimaricola variabilis]WPY96440.1 helix-turn-helix domain-containing protein [Limimaricola variabilis]
MTTMTFRIVFLPFDGFSNMVLASAIEPLRAACDLSGRPLFNWCVATPGGEAVSSSSGLRLAAEIELSEIGQCDALVLIAGYGAREAAARPELLPAIRAAARRSRTVTGLDMGAWIMAAAGLLEGYRATVHWHEMEAFAEEFAGVEAVAESYVTDGDRQSAGSATSAMELTLEAIRWLGGDALAYDVRTLFVHDDIERRRAESGALSPQLGRAVRFMLDAIEEPRSLVEVAAHAAVSLRTLDRLCRRELGTSAGVYYRALRLTRAQNLLTETGLPLREIALRCGFASASTLSRAYSQQFGRSLSATRRMGA